MIGTSKIASSRRSYRHLVVIGMFGHVWACLGSDSTDQSQRCDMNIKLLPLETWISSFPKMFVTLSVTLCVTDTGSSPKSLFFYYIWIPPYSLFFLGWGRGSFFPSFALFLTLLILAKSPTQFPAVWIGGFLKENPLGFFFDTVPFRGDWSNAGQFSFFSHISQFYHPIYFFFYIFMYITCNPHIFHFILE